MGFEHFGKRLKIEAGVFAFNLKRFPCLSNALKQNKAVNFEDEVVLHHKYENIASGNCGMLEGVVFDVTVEPCDINNEDGEWSIQNLDGLSVGDTNIVDSLSEDEAREIMYALNNQDEYEAQDTMDDLFCQTVVCE